MFSLVYFILSHTEDSVFACNPNDRKKGMTEILKSVKIGI